MKVTQKRQIIGTLLIILAVIQIVNFARLREGVFPAFYLDFHNRSILSLIIADLNWPFKFFNYSLYYLFGYAALLSPILFIILGFTFFRKRTQKFKRLRITLLWGFGELVLFIYIINYISFIVTSNKLRYGIVSVIFSKYLNKVGGTTFITLFFIWSLIAYILYLRKSTWKKFFKGINKVIKKAFVNLSKMLEKLFAERPKTETSNREPKKITESSTSRNSKKRLIEADDDEAEEIDVASPEPAKTKKAKINGKQEKEPDTIDSTILDVEFSENKITEFDSTTIDYNFPFDTLATNTLFDVDKAEIEEQEHKIYDTFKSHGVHLKRTGITKGARFIRLEYEMPRGILSREIEKYQDELFSRLGGIKTDIQIPIPGTDDFGVLLPRNKPDLLRLGSFIANHDKYHDMCVPVFIGVTPTGTDVWSDAHRFPHLLISGSTGSGKSVFLNSLIISLLAVSKEKPINIILIDPKRVEFSPYKTLPQLSAPIYTDVIESSDILKEAEALMEKRYERINDKGVRNITEYNEAVKHPQMPFLFIIIDEFADILLQDKNGEVKNSIIRLAQKSRAVGIHLVLATQRPSSKIIDGLIKANFPTRIAFSASSKVDSRIILDQNGAENLLGKGDMLFKDVVGQLQRLQGIYVDLDDIKKVTEK